MHKCGFKLDNQREKVFDDYAFITCKQDSCQPVCKGDLVAYKVLCDHPIRVVVSGYDVDNGAFVIGTAPDKRYGRRPFPAEIKIYNLNPYENYYFINFWRKLKYKPLE